MVETTDWPEIGEIVVVKVKRVLDYGVFVDLLEYNNQQGFVHISEIASRWVKNIRNHVKENQVRAALVLAINAEKKQIDLSLTKVSVGVQRAQIDEWKKSKRSQKLVELMAQKKKASFEDAWKAIAEPLQEHYNSLYEAFQTISMKGKSAAVGVLPQWMDVVVQTCQDSIVAPQKTVEAELLLSSFAPNGVEIIQQALMEGKKTGKEKVDIFYEGGGKYAVKITAENFKAAEKDLQAVTEKTVAVLVSQGGKAKIKRAEK